MSREKKEVDVEGDRLLAEFKHFEAILMSLAENPEEMKRQIEQDRRDAKAALAPLERLVSQAEAQISDPAYQAAHILKCNQIHFPNVVKKEVEHLLKVKSKDDIARVKDVLKQIEDNGLPAIWDIIKEDVTLSARRVCGTIFPDKDIDEGRNTVLDIKRLKEIVADQIKKYDVGSDTTSAKDSSPKSTFGGFRPGFLFAKPPVSEEKTTVQDGVNSQRPK